ncbi:MAG: ribosome maturation factor RimM [Gemmatimonadaceae bacterium]
MRTPADEGPSHAIVGRVRRSHGVRGELVVELFTDAPDAVFAPGARLFAGTTEGDLSPHGTTLHVESARPFKDTLLVIFAEISERNAADTWRDRFLLAPLSELEAPADDEVFLHELVGLRVLTVEGEEIGTVVAYFDLAHGLLLEVKRASGTVLLPYRDEFVAAVDVEAGVLTIDPPPGLFE